jgi:hypothetical protein
MAEPKIEAGSPPNYRPAPGMDRCDRCFFRDAEGDSCEKWPDFAGYVPNGLCDVFAPRSSAQPYGGDGLYEAPKGASGVEETPPAAAAVTPEPPAQRFATIANVELFRPGNWNGRKYTEADIDEMVRAAPLVGYSVPVTLGHTTDPSAPAYGYVRNLRKVNGVLVGDFEDVPEDLVQQIREKRYDAVSSEIYFELARDDQKFKKALRAVAVLGAHPPGVSSLKPLSEALAGLADDSRFESVDLTSPSAVTVSTPPSPAVHQEHRDMTTQTATTQAGGPPTNAPAGGASVEEVARLQEALAAAQREAQAANALVAAASTSQLTIQRLQETVQQLERSQSEAHEQARQDRINNLVGAVQRPSWRGHVRALAELGTRGDRPGATPETVLFQASGSSEAAPTNAVAVLEDFIRLLNSDTAAVLAESMRQNGHTRSLDIATMDDPGAQLFGLVQDYVRAHPDVNADRARQIIMQDPKHRDLVRRYNTPAGTVN